ncbi:hypothetical protein OGAPHI_001346 [Ogataea philodendri]|uniref:Dihydroxyacetone kinase n=1 Tax=Ogataea philodendri TaxID=1378263 RepID=A0A9P8PCL8_9ASCO|nr:uncharacterized protein OGAPHI_001346 [Ogataea philodendri]KAH3669225.1 hypothetical protein OGAPHI_001346 [Ogataea philodendri]
MSTKHFLPKDPFATINLALEGAVYENPNLSLLAKERVLYNNSFDSNKVALISGGGSGHEPGWYGFVADGMLAASVQGEIFASPNYRNIQAAEKVVHSKAGTIFLITNYTGDNLYFGMASQELVRKYGEDKIRILRTSDDVAVPRSKSDRVGRRTLSGITLMVKVLGACADELNDISTVFDLGNSVNPNIASINAGLDHVHIPTHDKTTDWGQLKPNELELGLGVHNEPGVKKLQQIPSNEELIKIMLKYLLDTTDPERGYFKYDKGDKIVLQLNNLGGVSHFEMLALMTETLHQLKDDYGIEVSRVYHGHFVTSFNAQIFTLTLFNVTKSATKKFSVEKLFEYLDKPVKGTNWPANYYQSPSPIDVSSRIDNNFKHYDEDSSARKVEKQGDVKVNPETLNTIIRTAVQNIIEKEPELTIWDTKMGDGDCGEGLKIGVEAILDTLENTKFTSSGSLILTLNTLLKVIKDSMGGTLGAILYIFLQGLTNKLELILESSPKDDLPDLFAEALDYAIENLCNYTKAREGDRTVMDVLIPFCRDFSKSRNIDQSIKVALDSAEGTRKIRPKLGRASYVGIDDNETDFPPDPGAYGVYEIISALNKL